MIDLTSLSEGIWGPKNRVFPTEEQKTILSSTNTGDTENRKEILNLIASENTANPADIAIAVKTYNDKKPILTNTGDTYQFIAASVSIEYITGTTGETINSGTTTTTTGTTTEAITGNTEETGSIVISGETGTTMGTVSPSESIKTIVTGFINYKINNVIKKIIF